MPTGPSTTVPRWKFPEWQPQLDQVLLEFDPKKLPSLVEAAATAIFVRLQSQKADPEELKALARALRSFRTIQTKRLRDTECGKQERCA